MYAAKRQDGGLVAGALTMAQFADQANFPLTNNHNVSPNPLLFGKRQA